MKWLAFLSPVTDLIGGWLNRRHELKLAKHNAKLVEIEAEADIKVAKANAVIENASKRLDADINWELMSIRNSGWKDEYLTVLITASLLMVFLPWTQPYMFDGFTALAAAPVWYQSTVIVVVGSAFGVRVWTNFTQVATRRRGAKTDGEA